MLAEASVIENNFAQAEVAFAQLINWLKSQESQQLSHHGVEENLHLEGIELLRLLYEGHLRERGLGYVGPSLVGSDELERSKTRKTECGQESIFGRVRIERLAYGEPGLESVRPKDAQLNLPEEVYSHGVRKRIAKEIAKSSFAQAIETVESTTGAHIPKRQAEELAIKATQDFDSFYDIRSMISPAEEPVGSIVVLTCDGKGINVREEDLRPATKAAAERAKGQKKKSKRLKKGQKTSRKRMSLVASVYNIEPQIRTAADIVSELDGVKQQEKKQAPRPESKRVWASIEKPREQVVREIFDEAEQRDTSGSKKWAGLVDGEEKQRELLEKEAEKRGIDVTIILDLIHVLEYLWKAAYGFYKEGSEEAQDWVQQRLRKLLEGDCIQVAAGIRRSATCQGLKGSKRKAVDKCCDYLLKNKEYLRYDEYLAAGFPIATGVIEGACRYLVKDRMERGKWSLSGAEAVLKLRALLVSGDFEAYWEHHMHCEYESNYGYNQWRPIQLSPNESSRRYGHLVVLEGGKP